MADRDYYSFLKLDDGSEIYYQFSTAQSDLYTVYFSPDEYSDFVKHYPNLLTYGFAFGFHKQKTTDSKNCLDENILETIYRIVLDFMSSNDNKTVLLYHCDQSDNRQSFRNRLFDKWANIIEERNEIKKRSINVVIDGRDSENVYMGFIVHCTNAVIDDIQTEFDGFAYNLTVVTNEKNSSL